MTTVKHKPTVGPKKPAAKKKPAPKPRILPVLPSLELDQVGSGTLNGGKASLLLRGAITGIERDLTIDGANTLAITVHDPEFELLRSKLLGEPLELDLGAGGRWVYRRGRDVGGLNVQGDMATITLWCVTSGALRSVSGPLARASGKLDLGGWVNLLAREEPIREAVPGLRVLVPKAGERPHPETTREPGEATTASASSAGFSGSGLFGMDGEGRRFDLNPSQVRMADEILQIARRLKAGAKATKAALVAGMIESKLQTGAPVRLKDADSRGPLQIRDKTARGMGLSGRTELIGPSFEAFFERGFTGRGGAIKLARENPGWTAGQVAQAVQGSAHPGRYDQAGPAADNLMSKWKGGAFAAASGTSGGGSGGAAAGASTPGAWRRGTPEGPESSWSSLDRHAKQLGMRRFIALPMSKNPRLVVASDQNLLTAGPHQTIDGLDDAVILSEPSVQLEGIKRAQTLSFDVRAATWQTPPGGVVDVREAGTLDGPWLCQRVRQVAGEELASITLQQATTKPEAIPSSSTAGTSRSTSLGSISFSSPSAGGGSSTGGLRQRIVAEATRTLTSKTGFRRYSQNASGGTNLQNPTPARGRTDCSQWVAAVYHKAGAPFPGGWSGEQARRGRRTTTPRPGDLVLDSPSGHRHVELYVGDGRTIGHGTAPIDYWTVAGMRQHFGGVFFVTFPALDRQ